MNRDMTVLTLFSLFMTHAVPFAMAEEPLWKLDFEDEQSSKPFFIKGQLDKTRSFANSNASLRAETEGNGRIVYLYRGRRVLFKTAPEGTLNFALWISEPGTLKLVFESLETGYQYKDLKIDEAGRWVTQQIPLRQVVGNQVRSVVKIKIQGPVSNEFWIDNVLIATGPLKNSAAADGLLEERARSDARAAALLKERSAQRLDLKTEYIVFEPETVEHLRRIHRRAQTAARTILCFGSGMARESAFVRLLTGQQELGYRPTILNRILSTAPAQTRIDQLLEKLKTTLESERPELVAITLGSGELAAGQTDEQIVKTLEQAVDLCLAAGAVPVLYTPAVANSGDSITVSAYKSLAQALISFAYKKRIPAVHAWQLMNAIQIDQPDLRLINAAGPTGAGYEAIDRCTVKLLRQLERFVFERTESNAAASISNADSTPLTAPRSIADVD